VLERTPQLLVLVAQARDDRLEAPCLRPDGTVHPDPPTTGARRTPFVAARLANARTATLGDMPPRQSAGILLFRRSAAGLEVLLAHPGGPFWAHRDAGAWSVPKGEHAATERALEAAEREFEEELGLPVPAGERIPLGTVRQRGGKHVTVWAVEGDLDPEAIVPGTFALEWPRGSGTTREVPEVDRVAWFALPEARERLLVGQRPLLDRLRERVEAA
jgi:predicted NUDIX family NTP pyrophosphohydrolase